MQVVLIEDSDAGRLIGKRGASIQRLREQSGAELKLLSTDESRELGVVGKRVLRVSAPSAAVVDRACALV